VDEATARGLFGQARVASLATVTAEGAPHIVPIVFALEGELLWTAVDAKPKRTTSLKRLANIRANPQVSVLVDHYEDDWTALWWVRADGVARLIPPDGRSRAREALIAKYQQYKQTPPPGPVIEVTVERWQGWAARTAAHSAARSLAGGVGDAHSSRP
jgi:PPOX class probable F420-dependent enzyme